MNMQIQTSHCQTHTAGYALMLVMIFTGISVLALTGALNWSAASANLTQRNNQYFNTLAAAEAATEKVISRVSQDFQSQGESLVFTSLSQYRDLAPATAENNYRVARHRCHLSHRLECPPIEHAA